MLIGFIIESCWPVGKIYLDKIAVKRRVFVCWYELLITLERSIRNIHVLRQNVNFCVKFNGQQKNCINFFCILSEYLYAINFTSLRMLVYLHYYINGCICVWRVQMHVVYATQFTFHRQISCVILLEHVKLISIKAQMNLFAQRFPVCVYMYMFWMNCLLFIKFTQSALDVLMVEINMESISCSRN